MEMPDLDLGLHEEELVVQRNPEALLDVLTIRSLRSRKMDPEVTSIASEPLLSLDRDIDTFVRDFKIDDSISDIFAMEEEPKPTKSKQSAGLRSQGPSQAKGWKKTCRRAQSVDNILEAAGVGSTSSKKQKTFGSIFSRKPKAKSESRKNKVLTWHTDTNNMPQPTSETKQRGGNSKPFPDKVEDVDGGYMTMNKAVYTGVNPTKSSTKDKVFEKEQNSSHLDSGYAVLHTVCTQNSTYDALVQCIDRGRQEDLIHDLSTMPPEVAYTLCDVRGNTILHRCVLKNKANFVSAIVSIHPGLLSRQNKEEITPAELAVKLGRVDCMKVFLQKCLSDGSETCVSELSSLLSYAMHSRQEAMAGTLLDHLSTLTAGSTTPMPVREKRGNPSHVAAKRDDISSLQRLVEMGFDVSSGTTEHDRPINVAYSNNSQTSFRYLLLLQVLETVLKEAMSLEQSNNRYGIIDTEERRGRDRITANVQLLRKAHSQYQKLLTRHTTLARQCADIVDDLMEDKENRTCVEKLRQLRCLLSSMMESGSDRFGMSRGIDDIAHVLQSRDITPSHKGLIDIEQARESTRSLLKGVHESWNTRDFDMTREVKKALSRSTSNQNAKPSVKTQRRLRDGEQVQVSSTCQDGDVVAAAGDARSRHPGRKGTTSRTVITAGGLSQDATKHTSNARLGQRPKSIPSEGHASIPRHQTPSHDYISLDRDTRSIDDLKELPSEAARQTQGHKHLRPKLSHDYAVIDKHSIERQNSAIAEFNENEKNVSSTIREGTPGGKKIPLSAQKSPDYATISSDIGEKTETENRDYGNNADFSDGDTMSTISSHNSSLQSAVAHLSRDYLSETGESFRSVSCVINARRGNTDIGQFDVSDFSADNSSDLLSVSCPTQNSQSQMSYCSEDDDENVCYNYVRLNLENEDLPDEVLRNHRLFRHLEAVQRLNTENSDVIETVVTASGERISSDSSDDSSSRFINVREEESDKSVQKHALNDKKQRRVKLFNLCELVSKRELTQSDFLECYDRSADVIHTQRCHDNLDLPWDQLQFSDVEDEPAEDRPWYEVSEDEESLAHAWSSDSEASTLCGSSTD
ncbi:uncharacterized protein LOC124279650 [Haliotis rubra]|uniref:uncharacterized protein LOC124279650 n=1 Tax=Haliotis rubra TaxID=36100 RepID=UPI001EE61323|nr:uncharacterized protein LOC124279650 [Haliotis rubra]XP_046571443.1 uncharacterized protein LOC124279650 [Haliotis rubra]